MVKLKLITAHDGTNRKFCLNSKTGEVHMTKVQLAHFLLQSVESVELFEYRELLEGVTDNSFKARVVCDTKTIIKTVYTEQFASRAILHFTPQFASELVTQGVKAIEKAQPGFMNSVIQGITDKQGISVDELITKCSEDVGI